MSGILGGRGFFENDGYRVIVDHEPYGPDAVIHILRYGLRGREVVRDYVSIGAKGEMSLTPLDEHGFFPEAVTPTIHGLDVGLLRALAGALAEAGYMSTTASEAKAQGAMESMARHLEDMRRLALRNVPAVAA